MAANLIVAYILFWLNRSKFEIFSLNIFTSPPWTLAGHPPSVCMRIYYIYSAPLSRSLGLSLSLLYRSLFVALTYLLLRLHLTLIRQHVKKMFKGRGGGGGWGGVPPPAPKKKKIFF